MHTAHRIAAAFVIGSALAACASAPPKSREQLRFESWVESCRAARSTQPGYCAQQMMAREEQRARAHARSYHEQDNFDQWAASCKNAEARDAARCAATMHTIQKRGY